MRGKAGLVFGVVIAIGTAIGGSGCAVNSQDPSSVQKQETNVQPMITVPIQKRKEEEEKRIYVEEDENDIDDNDIDDEDEWEYENDELDIDELEIEPQ